MILKQYYLGCLAHASYLVGDEQARRAVVVDPQRDVDRYLADAHDLGLTITHVFLTHFHADFVAGHLELRDRAGARIALGARARAEYPFEPFEDGQTLDLGRVRLRVLHTPGHTPEAICILVYDLGRDAARPHAVLTGDTLFIGDVGRPDLAASEGVAPADLAGMLYRSIRERLLPLPDSTLLYPAHGAGSLCGKNLSTDTVSTIGDQRRYNYALQPMSRDDFVALVTADQPETPGYFVLAAQLNRMERPTLERSLSQALRPLALDERDEADFAGAHLAGAVNVGLDGPFAAWAGTVLERDRPIVIVAAPGREEEAAVRLGRVGFDHVAGYLDGGMAALEPRPDLVARVERMAPAALAERLAADPPPVVLDVRTDAEWRTERIEGSLNLPLARLRRRAGDLPRGRQLVVHCASGYRSSIGASLLAGAGLPGVWELVGGIGGWKAARLPTIASPGPPP